MRQSTGSFQTVTEKKSSGIQSVGKNPAGINPLYRNQNIMIVQDRRLLYYTILEEHIHTYKIN